LTIDGGGVGSEFDGAGGASLLDRAAVWSGVVVNFGIDVEGAVFDFATEGATSGLEGGGGTGSGIAETIGVSIGSVLVGLEEVTSGATEYKDGRQNSIPF
jgi:hypothetical protein